MQALEQEPKAVPGMDEGRAPHRDHPRAHASTGDPTARAVSTDYTVGREAAERFYTRLRELFTRGQAITSARAAGSPTAAAAEQPPLATVASGGVSMCAGPPCRRSSTGCRRR